MNLYMYMQMHTHMYKRYTCPGNPSHKTEAGTWSMSGRERWQGTAEGQSPMGEYVGLQSGLKTLQSVAKVYLLGQDFFKKQ